MNPEKVNECDVVSVVGQGTATEQHETRPGHYSSLEDSLQCVGYDSASVGDKRLPGPHRLQAQKAEGAGRAPLSSGFLWKRMKAWAVCHVAAPRGDWWRSAPLSRCRAGLCEPGLDVQNPVLLGDLSSVTRSEDQSGIAQLKDCEPSVPHPAGSCRVGGTSGASPGPRPRLLTPWWGGAAAVQAEEWRGAAGEAVAPGVPLPSLAGRWLPRICCREDFAVRPLGSKTRKTLAAPARPPQRPLLSFDFRSALQAQRFREPSSERLFLRACEARDTDTAAVLVGINCLQRGRQKALQT